MRVGIVQNFRNTNLSFGNLTNEEKEAFKQTKKEALDIIGRPEKSVFIYSSACLPRSAESNIGTGTLLSKQGEEFLDVVRTFTPADTIQDVPAGEFMPKPANGYYGAYETSSQSLSSHLIEPELLTDERFGKIITPEELQEVVSANNGQYKDVLANFENVVEPGSPFDNLLKKAYERFKTGEGEKLDVLRSEFADYKTKNTSWLEPHSIYSVLSKKYNNPMSDQWENETDKRLYDVTFSEEARNARKAEILKESADDIEFYNFKQFLSDKFLGLAREKAHEKGLKFGGDVPYQFTLSDVFSNPKAFSFDVFMGPRDLKIPALDFYQIADPNSAAAKMLAQKFSLAAQRYDTLRVGMGWGYVTPMLSNSSGSYNEKKYMGSQVLDLIENAVKSVKGDDFNRSDLFYEIEAGEQDFKAFNDDGTLLEPLKDRVKIYSSDYMSEGWGSSRVYPEKFKMNPSEFMYGASNVNTTPLMELASHGAYEQRKEAQVSELSEILHIKPSTLENADEFIRAKNAEPLLAKNNFMFFTELFGMDRRFNDLTKTNSENFRVKIPANPEQAYYDAVKEGHAFNIMDAFEKVFKAKGYDKKHPELFTKIVEFKNKLYGIDPEKLIDETAEGMHSEPPVINPVNEPEVEKPAVETVEKAAKKNKYLKPALIITVAAVALYSAYKYFSKKPKAA